MLTILNNKNQRRTGNFFKTLSSSSPNTDLSENITLSQSQSRMTVPLMRKDEADAKQRKKVYLSLKPRET